MDTSHTIVLTHIDLIRPGDTVEINGGSSKAVCGKDIRRGFMGVTLWGDSYRMGTIPVRLAIPTKKG